MISSAMTLLALITGTSLGVLLYNQAFTTIKITQQSIGPYTYLYFNTNQPYSQTSQLWTENNNRIGSFFTNSTTPAGIYYDNPATSKTEQSRLSVGFLVESSESSDKQIQEFLKTYPQYKLAQLPRVEAVATSFPYISPLTYLIQTFKVYPQLNQYLQNNNIQNACLFEIYNFNESSSSNKNIEYFGPFGKAAEKYLLF